MFVSFLFVSKQRKTFNAVGMSSFIFWLQAKELWLSVCFNTFRNFNRSLNKRRMSPAQTITTERTAEKCLDKRVQSKQTLKHKLGNWTNRWSKVQEDARYPSSKKQFKQQRQQRQRQRRLKNDLIFNLRISREFRFIQFVYTVRNISNRTCKTASKFEKETLKIGRRIVHVHWNTQNMAILRCCFVTFCNLRQRNEQRIITHVYTAIELVAVAVKVCLIKPPKTD